MHQTQPNRHATKDDHVNEMKFKYLTPKIIIKTLDKIKVTRNKLHKSPSPKSIITSLF